MNWLWEGMKSIGEGMATFTLWPDPPKKPKFPKILTPEEAMKADADAIRKDFESIIGKW